MKLAPNSNLSFLLSQGEWYLQVTLFHPVVYFFWIKRGINISTFLLLPGWVKNFLQGFESAAVKGSPTTGLWWRNPWVAESCSIHGQCGALKSYQRIFRWVAVQNHKITEQPELKETHNDHQAQLLHRTPPKIKKCAWEWCPDASWTHYIAWNLNLLKSSICISVKMLKTL